MEYLRKNLYENQIKKGLWCQESLEYMKKVIASH